jgi:regulatory protein
VNRQAQDPAVKARGYAFLLLKFRPRSEKEIAGRLKKKKFSPQVIRETVLFLKTKDFIDDQHFARAWVDSRRLRNFGPRRIRQELKLKGVAGDIIDQQLAAGLDNYSEKNIVEKLIQNKLRRAKGLEPQKAKRRVYAYLLRRGFSADVILEVLQDRVL